MALQCIIIDDDDLAIRLLEDFVQQTTALQLVKSFENAVLAKEYLHHNSVDVIFLDIQMPYLSGLDFLEQLQQKPAVIITTSYPQYALDGYRLSVVDYLLKPFLIDRFNGAVQKAADYCHYRKMIAEGNEKSMDHLFIKSDHKMIKVLFNDIFFIEGLKQYIKIHLADKFIVTLESMKRMEELLPQDVFIRIHKSYIICTTKVDSYNNNEVNIKNTLLPVGKTYKQLLEKFFI
jgi:two-component system, LytTR family, response regulator